LADREKFVELAEKRVRKTIKDIRLIGNLSNRANYSYTDADVRKIHAAIERELKNLKRRFEAKSNGDEIDFRL